MWWKKFARIVGLGGSSRRMRMEDGTFHTAAASTAAAAFTKGRRFSPVLNCFLRYEVGDFLAREKTSQAFRDVLHDKYKSSNTSKKKRRQEEQAEKLFRAHSNRSLDAGSVHTAGSTPDCEYSTGHDSSKLMRLERSDLTGFTVEESSSDDLLGALDMELASSFGGRKGLASQRSLRSVMEVDRRQIMMRQAKSGHSVYNHSCPNLFKPRHIKPSTPQQSGLDHPPIPTQVVLEDSVMEPNPFETMRDPMMDTIEGSYPSSSRPGMDFNIGVQAGQMQASQMQPGQMMHPGQPARSEWMHHSQPNLYANAHTPNMPSRRRQFARMPPHRQNSAQNMARQGSLRSMSSRQNSLKNVMARQNSAKNVMSGIPGSHLLSNSSHHSHHSHGHTHHVPMNNLSSASNHSRHSMTVFEEQLDNLALSDRAPPPPPSQPSREMPGDIDINDLVLSPMAGETKDSLLASLASLSDSFAIEPIEESPFEPMPLR